MNLLTRVVEAWERIPVVIRVLILWAMTLVMWVTVVGHVLDNTPVDNYIRGGTADWLVAREAWTGGDPYAPLDQLAEEQLGWLDTEPTHPHPRPPSALFMLGPLALSPPEGVIWTLALANSLALAVWVVTSVSWAGFPARAEILIVPIALARPSINSVVWGSHIPVVAAFVGFSLCWARNRATRGTGIAFASGLKLFPFLLVFAEKRHRLRAIAWAAGAFLVLTALGLLLPGVELGDALNAITNAPESYGSTEASDVNLALNGTLGWELGSFVLPLIGIALVVAASFYFSLGATTSIALVAMVLFAPYAWPEYMILWLPSLLYLWTRGGVARVTVIAFLLAMFATRRGWVFMVAGLLILLASALTELKRDKAMEGAAY